MTDVFILPQKLVQVDLFADGVFDRFDTDVALVKTEGSAWIDSSSQSETSFRWQDLDSDSYCW